MHGVVGEWKGPNLLQRRVEYASRLVFDVNISLAYT